MHYTWQQLVIDFRLLEMKTGCLTLLRPSHQAPDSKREQFRRYLEKAGVVDSLTKGRPDLAFKVVSCTMHKLDTNLTVVVSFACACKVFPASMM